jgi:hypothetical protein
MFKRKSANDAFSRLERLESKLYCRQVRNAVARMSENERKNACRSIMEELRDLEAWPGASGSVARWSRAA